MPVDAEIQPLLAEMNGPPLSEIPLELLREGSPIPTEAPVPVADVVNRTISVSTGDLPVRIYYPLSERGLPALVYFHGGGYVLGDLDAYDSVLRKVALGAGCMVVSVDYRLAPENPFPAAADDAFAAARWVRAHATEIGADPDRIVTGGDSAGGALATVTALRLRDEGDTSLLGQLLIYPYVQLRAPLEGSMAENGDDYFLKATDLAWFEDMYLGASTDGLHPYASPLLIQDLSGLPPAFVVTAGFDPLRDQGMAYVTRLTEAGNDCIHRHYAGAIHGFFGMPTEISRRVLADACEWLTSTFGDRK